MRACFGANSVTVMVDPEDREKDKLECIIDEFKRPKVILKVKPHVESGFLEEPGFHIQCWPPNVSSRNSTKIYVYLSQERWNDLFTKWDNESKGGFFASRCIYDRFHILYYDPDREWPSYGKE